MKVSLTFALAFAVLGAVDRADAISQETLDDWVVKHDLLDLDYKAHFQSTAKIPPLTLRAAKSFGQTITLTMTTNDKLFDGGQRIDELEDDFFVGTVAGQPQTSTASLTIWATGLTGQITLLGVNGVRQTIYVDKFDGTNQTVLYNKADRKTDNFPSFEGDVVTYDELFPSNDGPKRSVREKASKAVVPEAPKAVVPVNDEDEDVTSDDETTDVGTSDDDTSADDTSADDTSADDTSADDTSDDGTSDDDTSDDDTSVDDTSDDDTSVDDTSDDDTSDDESAEESSVEDEDPEEDDAFAETAPGAVPDTESLKGPGLRLMIVDEETAREDLPAANLTKRQARTRLRVNKDCKVAIVADSTFVERFGDKTVKQMVAIMADVREIYERNFGIGLTIGAVYVDRKDNMKLRNNGKGNKGSVSNVLKSFTSSVTKGQIKLADDICAAHLFTSRTFGATLGVAFVASPDNDIRGGICSNSANTGVHTHIGSRGTALPISAWVATVAHEMGHLFGASHDESTQCAGDREIMAAAVRSDGPPVDDFSSCSMQAIKQVIQTKATCLV